MLHDAADFLVLSTIAALVGFGVSDELLASVGRWVSYVALGLALLSFFGGLSEKKTPERRPSLNGRSHPWKRITPQSR